MTRELIRKNPLILTTEIENFKSSELYQKMLESDDYYMRENRELMARRQMMWITGSRVVKNEHGEHEVREFSQFKEDETKANNKVPHGFHYELVNQCKNFLASSSQSWPTVVSNDIFTASRIISGIAVSGIFFSSPS